MVTRVAGRTVPEDQWRPVIGAMTGVALQTRDKVSTRFACCLCAVMATRTGSGHAVMIEVCRNPGTSRVADITLCRGLNVLSVLAGGRRSVVAAATGSRRNAAVIEDGA